MSAVLEETPEPDAVARREKSAGAFRTISEVSEELDIPAHVLRFWESKFPHLNPMKRGGGRRYYRPADLALLRGIRRLLHDEGLTIRGLQKVFRERGPRFVAAVGDGGEVASADLKAMAVEDADAPEAAAPGADATPHRDRLLAIVATLQAARDRLADSAAPAGKRG